MIPAGGWRSIPEMTAAAAADHGGQLAVVDGDRRLSYAELFDRVRRFGGSLVASGAEPGERVGIWAANSLEWVVAALGTLQAGGVVVPVNTRFKGAEAADVLSRSGARVLVTMTDFLGVDHVALLEDAGFALSTLRSVVVARGPAREGTETVGVLRRSGHDGGGGRGRPALPPASGPTSRRTSCSPRGPPAPPRASSRRTAGRCGWPRTGWP